MAKVTLDMAALDRLSRGAAEGGVRAVLGESERILKSDILNRPGTGRTYGKHRASAPGQPPAPDLGNLRANTNAGAVVRHTEVDATGSIVANAGYAEALEKGTERMRARPYFGLLVSGYRPALTAAFERGAKE